MEEFCSCLLPGRRSGVRCNGPSPALSWSCPVEPCMEAQRRHDPFSLRSHHLPFFQKKRKERKKKNQHLWYSWVFTLLIFLGNTTGNVPSIPVPSLMYFFNVFLVYFVSHKLKVQHHSVLINCS